MAVKGNDFQDLLIIPAFDLLRDYHHGRAVELLADAQGVFQILRAFVPTGGLAFFLEHDVECFDGSACRGERGFW